jgi:hypothetical protein
MDKIDPASIDKLTQDRSVALTNIVIDQGIKKIILEDSKITIYFDNEDEQEKNQNKPEPPVNG